MSFKVHKKFGVYIHWPFCQAKCPYCDFNSHVRQNIDQNDWANGYVKSLNYWAEKTNNHKISSVFFGGGTPSLMSERTLDKIMNTLSKLWKFDDKIEITMEANPTSVESGKFNSYKTSGVNRLSMGVQALNDKDLKRLGRLHTVKEAKEAFNIACLNFNRVSFDLMYGRQYQTVKDWELELSLAVSMAVDHLSLYQLTVESNTRFGELFSKGKLLGLPKDDLSVEFYNLTQDMTEKNAVPAYEISNHAKIGEECQHNLNYWDGGDFLGIGPGAHGRLTIKGNRIRTEAPLNPELWLKYIDKNNYDSFVLEKLSANETAEEYVIMALRLTKGLDINRYIELTGSNFLTEVQNELVINGLIELNNHSLKVTKAGKVFTDHIIKKLLC
jgi:oxygen-independent coproporphyrinogen-3 oxidase